MRGDLIICIIGLILLGLILLWLFSTCSYDPYHGYVIEKRRYGRGFDLRVKRKISEVKE